MQNYTGPAKYSLEKLVVAVKATGAVPKEESRQARAAPVTNSLNLEQLGKIRKWVFTAGKKGVPITVERIRQKVALKFRITIPDTSMRRILTKKLGLKYKRISSHTTMVESASVMSLVKSYLAQLRELRPQMESGELLLVCTDESYIHHPHAQPSMWTHVEDDDRVFGSPKVKGRRIIVMHYGCKEGWIDGAKKV